MELKQYEEKVIFKHFDNDKDHQYIHGIEVMNMANDINETLEMNINSTLIFLASISHDIEATKSPETHHKKAHDFVLENKKLIMKEYRIEEGDILLIAMACLQHRKEFNDEFHSGLAEIINISNQIVKGNFDNNLLKEYSKEISYDFQSHDDVLQHLYDVVDLAIFKHQDKLKMLHSHYQNTTKKKKLALLSKYIDYLLDKNPDYKKKSFVLQMNVFK